MSSAPTPSTARTTLVIAELVTALLLILVGVWLIVLFGQGVNGGASLVVFAAIEIVLGLLSLAAVGGLRAGRRPRWVARLTIVGAAFNAAVIALAAVATISITYPGGPVVLLILCNDVVLGELVVFYFLARSSNQA